MDTMLFDLAQSKRPALLDTECEVTNGAIASAKAGSGADGVRTLATMSLLKNLVRRL